MILLATGISLIEEELVRQIEAKRCYNRDILLDIARELKPETVVLSPYLPGEGDLVSIILSLRGLGKRVIFLPGDPRQQDARGWMIKLIPYGVYDYVYDPVTTHSVIARIQIPATLGDIPHEIVKESQEKGSGFAKDVVDSIKVDQDKGLFSALRRRRKEKKEDPTEARPRASWLTKTGYIENGELVKESIKTPDDVRQGDWDAVVVPSWPADRIRDLRRSIKNTALIVVLKGGKEHLEAGADKVVRKVTPELINEVTATASRLRNLWQQSESDPLTGAYTRRFFNLWLAEQQKREIPFSVCLTDLDHFKRVNDTYGHDAGDAALKAFAHFLKTNLRKSDVVCRYGGEEFVIGLPATRQGQAYVLLDRLRQQWQERTVIHGGANIKTTFSAGIAEYSPGIDVIKLADEQLYEAKSKGRNQVHSTRNRVHVMVKEAASIVENLPIQVVSDPLQADIIIADAKAADLVADTSSLIVVSETDLGQWALKQKYPGATVTTINRLPEVLSEVLGISAYVPKIQVLPGARKSDKGTSVTRNSAIYIVCPSRPSQAGETAALLASSITNIAVVCASPASTAAICLGITKQDLVGCDWRVPNANAPVIHNGIYIWPIDPELYQVRFDVSPPQVANSIRHKFDLVLVDCAGDLSLCTSAPNSDLVMVIHKEGDTSDYLTQEWLRQYNYRNTCLLSPAEIPQIIAVENGFIFARGVAHESL